VAINVLRDPIASLGFLVHLDDALIGRFSECTGLSAEYDVMTYEEGGENRFTHKLRGRMKWPNLVLKRGITTEDALLKWFRETRTREKRGTVTITLLGPPAIPRRIWAFARAYPVKWEGPSLSSGGNAIGMESIEIAHEGLVLHQGLPGPL
jgi:phage tail-like protein